ncbi:manganese efflux pump MntP family protein [Microbacterium sp. BG28]|uniref:manganese efflux pump MntP n=1 Tax=Microbacterium sp. BG28 TaxID=3097356 RepID=UPI002A5A7C56|nr:manganese efflux pump MntP family protein [Microbacterium sp. BG28]MDY0827806.1 manganese efflux pump MntP family protein [Microbacterium sp. BG28]
MSFWALPLLAVGVSADAFAVALGKGLQLRSQIVRNALVLALAFGLAQALMPLLGYLLGSAFAAFIEPFDHWVAFALLAAVGVKMLWEALTPDKDGAEAGSTRLSTRETIVLAVATSIDALAVGLSFAFLNFPVWIAVIAIGLVTFVLSFAAVLIGHRIGTRFRRPAEIVGGLVLIGIGTQILISHLTA